MAKMMTKTSSSNNNNNNNNSCSMKHYYCCLFYNKDLVKILIKCITYGVVTGSIVFLYHYIFDDVIVTYRYSTQNYPPTTNISKIKTTNNNYNSSIIIVSNNNVTTSTSNLNATSNNLSLNLNNNDMSSSSSSSLVDVALIDCEENNPHRCSRTLNATHTFSFVHISKAAGSSWIYTLKQIFMLASATGTAGTVTTKDVPTPTNFYPQKECGDEFPVLYQKKIHPSKYTLISIKSPRHHVFSLFAECKYDPYFIKQTKSTNFPRSGKNESDDVIDFSIWLDHFLVKDIDNDNDNDNDNNKNGTITKKKLKRDDDHYDYYKCYHPSNYQSRQLTETKKDTHGLNGGMPLEPPLDVANEALYNMDWVTLTEFFHESKCLLYYRLGITAPSQAILYLEDQCRCPKPTATATATATATNSSSSSSSSDIAAAAAAAAAAAVNEEVHIVHHKEGHRSSMNDLSDDIHEKISILTKIDVQVYRIALIQFIKEIHWLESKSSTTSGGSGSGGGGGGGMNRRVLCDETLQKYEEELSYLNINLTDLYYNTNKYA
jgi:hypothetical protein